MAEDVGTRAVRVGLATREQLAEALALSQRTGMPLVEALVCVGVPDDALEALFVAEGLAERLEGGLPEERRPDVLPGFGGAMALAFLALRSRASRARSSWPWRIRRIHMRSPSSPSARPPP